MDRIYSAFLARQIDEAAALTASSDLVAIRPVQRGSATRFLCEFRCKGLVRSEAGIAAANRFDIGIWFPSDYLRQIDPMRIVSVVEPRNLWHPNVNPPFMCIGHMPPGTDLVSLVHQVFEIITYQKVTMREDDALNPEACGWSRRNSHRFPIDPRPLRHRHVDMEIEAPSIEDGRSSW